MAPSSFEKSVKGGTKIKLAPPKSKYVEHILLATQSGEAGVAEVFRTMTNRLRDSTWTIVFKALIIVHLMIREGEPSVTLKFLSETPTMLAISNFTDMQIQGGNIRHYYTYILSRAKAYRDTRTDWVREGNGRLKKQTIDKGLLRETEIVQKQISTLLKCDLLSSDIENEITLTAFRLLTMDLLVLYSVMNEGTINVLEHYFEMSKSDAERALMIYKTFSRQTNEVVAFLGVARQYENATRLEIPKLKHAPTSLTASLEEYLLDPDFEINRRQYMAQQEAKKGGRFTKKEAKEPPSKSQKEGVNNSASSQSFAPPSASQPAIKAEPKGPAPDLIDFFESIEQNQQPMAAQPQQQISNYQPVPQYQFPQSTFPGPQDFHAPQNQPQVPNGSFMGSNPFGQLASQGQMVSSPSSGGFSDYSSLQTPQSQQPFSPGQMSMTSNPQDQTALFSPQQQSLADGQQSQQQQQQQFNNFQPQPFTTSQPFSPQAASPIQPQSTNPFRQSMMPTADTNGQPPDRQSTNPFARLASQQSGHTSQPSPFTSQPPISTSSPFFTQQPMSPQSTTTTQPPQFPQPPLQPQFPAQPLQLNRTGTNPFARSTPPSASQTPMLSPLVAQTTGTNPFRQSAFVQSNGQGWLAGQGTMGGLETLETVPVFPRPGQQVGQQQQQGWPH